MLLCVGANTPMNIGQIKGLLEKHQVIIYNNASLCRCYYRLVSKVVESRAGFDAERKELSFDFQTHGLPDSVMAAFGELQKELQDHHGITLSTPE